MTLIDEEMTSYIYVSGTFVQTAAELQDTLGLTLLGSCDLSSSPLSNLCSEALSPWAPCLGSISKHISQPYPPGRVPRGQDTVEGPTLRGLEPEGTVKIVRLSEQIRMPPPPTLQHRAAR